MKDDAHKLAQTGLQWSLGLVLIYECSRFLFSAETTGVVRKMHVHPLLLSIIAAVELLGAVLFLIPQAIAVGSRLLLATFGVAAIIHILHGQPDIGYLIIYALAVLTVVTGK